VRVLGPAVMAAGSTTLLTVMAATAALTSIFLSRLPGARRWGQVLLVQQCSVSAGIPR
jgi:hypothetical protein